MIGFITLLSVNSSLLIIPITTPADCNLTIDLLLLKVSFTTSDTAPDTPKSGGASGPIKTNSTPFQV